MYKTTPTIHFDFGDDINFAVVMDTLSSGLKHLTFDFKLTKGSSGHPTIMRVTRMPNKDWFILIGPSTRTGVIMDGSRHHLDHRIVQDAFKDQRFSTMCRDLTAKFLAV